MYAMIRIFFSVEFFILFFCHTFPIGTRAMKADIYFVRHGETTANRDGILQGHCDFPLTEKGHRDAALVGTALRHTRWTKIYTSDLTRASNTAQIILSQSKNPKDLSTLLTTTPLIREVNFGVREMLPRGTTVEEAFQIVAEREGISLEDVTDTAETDEHIIERQKIFLEALFNDLENLPSLSVRENEDLTDPPTSFEDAHETGRPLILCVSHGGFIKRFLKNFCGIGSIEKIGNCSISVVHVDWSSPGEFCVTADEARLNRMDHINAPTNV
jgi:probable phosphoglycerate mutase